MEKNDLISRKALLAEMNYMFGDDDALISPMDAKLLVKDAPAVEAEPRIEKVEISCFYDKEEIYENCTVQVLTNTVTGEVSVGWWQNGSGPEVLNG